MIIYLTTPLLMEIKFFSNFCYCKQRCMLNVHFYIYEEIYIYTYPTSIHRINYWKWHFYVNRNAQLEL